MGPAADISAGMTQAQSRGGGAAVCSLLAAAVFPILFAPSVPAQQPLVFEAEAALMEIEARVTDGKGRTAADLTKEDFELFENGRRQAIATFEFVPQATPPDSPAETASGGPLPETPSAAARGDLRRSTFIYVATRGRREDRLPIFNAVRNFIDENLRPGVFVSLEGSAFTSRKSELYRELDEMLSRGAGRGGGAGSFVDTLAVDLARDIEYNDDVEQMLAEANEDFGEQIEEIGDRAALYRRLRMYEYIDLIRALEIYPGKKLVVLFASGLPVDEENLDIMKVLEDEATRARVRFYVSDVGRLQAVPPGGDAEGAGGFNSLFGDVLNNGFAAAAQQRQDNQDGLFELARRTGGRAVLNSNDFGEIFDVVNRESGGYYLLGYYPEDGEQRGRLRRLRVEVKRKGLKVSHQRGYYEERPFERMSQSERNLRMHQALLFDTPYADLPIQVGYEYFRDSQGRPTLAYSVGLHTSDLPAAATKKGRALKLTIAARADPAADERTPGRQPLLDEGSFRMTLPEAEFERLSSDPIAFLHYGSQMPLMPGLYDWKVVVRDDGSGALGSFQTRLRIPASTAALGASSLLLTGRIEDTAAAKPKKTARNAPEDVLEVAGSRFYTSAKRVFRTGDSIYLLYDVYNPGASSLADPPAPRLALYRGRERVERLPAKGHQTVAQPDSGRIRYLAALATDDLAPGNYTLAAMLPSASAARPVIYRKFEIVAAEGN